MKTIKMTMITAMVICGTVIFASNPPYLVGDKANDFKLKNVDGKWVSLGDFKKSKGVILVFTCNHCPYAKAYEDRIIALNAKYASRDFPVIAINPNDPTQYPDDSYENMQKRAAEKDYTFPYLFDEEQTVYPQFGATKTPHVFVLANSGDVFTVEYIGAIDDNYEDASKVTNKYVENAVDAILAGKKPEVTTTKAIGCSIKARQK